MADEAYGETALGVGGGGVDDERAWGVERVVAAVEQGGCRAAAVVDVECVGSGQVKMLEGDAQADGSGAGAADGQVAVLAGGIGAVDAGALHIGAHGGKHVCVATIARSQLIVGDILCEYP